MSSSTSRALVVMLSDRAAKESPLETFFLTNFSNVTEVRHGDFSNPNSVLSQDALLGKGRFSGKGPADLFVIGRSVESMAYKDGKGISWNRLEIPVVSFTSYVVASYEGRLGWHDGAVLNKQQSRKEAETKVTDRGAEILKLKPGDHDLWKGDKGFNGLGADLKLGGGELLATLRGKLLVAYWKAGAAPGNPEAAGLEKFPGVRLLFNLDNEPNKKNDGANDLSGLSATGMEALRSAIDYATPLKAYTNLPQNGLLTVPNDHFVNATEIPNELPFQVMGTLGSSKGGELATRQEGEPRHAGRPGFGSVWYQWDSVVDRRISVSVDSDKIGAVLAVYTGKSIRDLRLVHRYNSFAFPAFSRKRSEPFASGARVEFNAKARETYYFAIDTENRFFGPFLLTIRESSNPLNPLEELVEPGHRWEYLFATTQDGVPFDPQYRDDDFDTTWTTPENYDGPDFQKSKGSPTGWGETGPEKIRIHLGRSPEFKPTDGALKAAYFRTTIVPESEVVALGVEGIFADGAIVYVNGKEGVRTNVAGDADAGDWRLAAAGGSDLSALEERELRYGVIDGLSLPAGEPVHLALSVHCRSAKSSGLGMDLRVYSISPPKK